MIKRIPLNIRDRACVALACIAVAACASSGDGGNGGGGPGPGPSPNPQPPAPPGIYWSTLLSGAVGAPGSAPFGAEPVTATSGGRTFDGSGGGYASDVSFPVRSSGLEATAGGLSAAAADSDATVTVDTSATNNYATLRIPSLNIEAQLYWSPVDGLVDVFSYVVLGHWADAGRLGQYNSITAFAFGYETPNIAMPSTGTAVFSGRAGATVLKPINGDIRATYVMGSAGFSVDFASGNITGAFTGMQQSDNVSYANGPGQVPPVTGSILGGPGSLPWNNVSITASIAGGTNRFSGNTAATSAPDTTFSLAGTATGHIDGAFYGPNAENLGAIWSLSDGTASALGTVGATR